MDLGMMWESSGNQVGRSGMMWKSSGNTAAFSFLEKNLRSTKFRMCVGSMQSWVWELQTFNLEQHDFAILPMVMVLQMGPMTANSSMVPK